MFNMQFRKNYIEYFFIFEINNSYLEQWAKNKTIYSKSLSAMIKIYTKLLFIVNGQLKVNKFLHKYIIKKIPNKILF